MVASFAKMHDQVTPEEIGLKSTDTSIASLELAHASSVLNESASISTEIELMRKARGLKIPGGAGERYIDDLAAPGLRPDGDTGQRGRGRTSDLHRRGGAEEP